MIVSIEEKLKKRKLDALRRGVHRVEVEAELSFNVHFVGIGKAGCDIVAASLRALPPEGDSISVLVVDLGDEALEAVRIAVAALPEGRVALDVVSLTPADSGELETMFASYETYLKLEYPFYPWKFDRKGWLPEGASTSTSHDGVRRSYAKALYGRAYYDGERQMMQALRRIGERVESEKAQSIVSVVFGLGGGTGSGVVLDLARHLTNVALGRRALVVGIGVLPCDGDMPHHRGGALFATLNEFDCLGDDTKNKGVVMSCGELFRNPFTAGLLLVPQQHVWCATGDLTQTHHLVDAQIVSLLTAREGANLLETLRMLNWVAAPSNQHSAARTPWGDKWIHMFGFTDLDSASSPLSDTFCDTIGIGKDYRPEFMEIRLATAEQNDPNGIAGSLEKAFNPEVSPQITAHGHQAFAQFILPSIRKKDLHWFETSAHLYRQASEEARVLDHALLLDQGIVLSEPSSRMAGMSGAGLNGSEGWVAVSMSDLMGSS